MNSDDRSKLQGSDKSQWLIYSSRFLFKHQFCSRCTDFGLDVEALHIFHIEPVDGYEDLLFWSPDNHLAVCSACYAVFRTNRATQSRL